MGTGLVNFGVVNGAQLAEALKTIPDQLRRKALTQAATAGAVPLTPE